MNNSNTSDLYLQSLMAAIANTVGDAFTNTVIKKHSSVIDPSDKPAACAVKVLLNWTTQDFGQQFTENVARRAYVTTLTANPSEQQEILSLIPENLLQQEREQAVSVQTPNGSAT